VTGQTALADPNRSRDRDVLADVAQTDKKAARIIAKGLREQAHVDAAARKVQADAEAARAREEARARERAAAARRRQSRRARWRARWARMAHGLGWLAVACWGQAASAASLVVYACVVYTAATSQMQVFRERFGWAESRAVGAAVFLEGLALVFALTAHVQRRAGESARAARVLTVLAALFSAGFNFAAHVEDPVLSPGWALQEAIAVAGSSLAGIVVWEVRSGTRIRPLLRRMQKLPEPIPGLGARYCLRFPRPAYWAWSAMVADPRIRTREDAIARGAEMMAAHEAKQAARRRKRRRAGGLLRRNRNQRRELLTAMRDAALTAAANGDPRPALAYLAVLAEAGPAPAPDGGPEDGDESAAADAQPDSDLLPEPQPATSPATIRSGCDCGQALRGITVALNAVAAQVAGLGQQGHGPTDGPPTPEQRWQKYLDELDAAYRTADGAELEIPSRRRVIARMREFPPKTLAGTWTNHDFVDRARRDLQLRRQQQNEPQPAGDEVSPSASTA